MRIVFTILALTVALTVPGVAQQADISPLVSAEWLKANAGRDNLVIVDIRNNVEAADLGGEPYVKGAVVAPYAQAGWRTEIDGVPGMMPPVDRLAERIGGLGIGNDDHVVIVTWGTDSTEFGGATRVYWTFRYLGHDAVSIVDGGWRRYVAAGGPRTAVPAKPQPVAFSYELQDHLLATTEDVLAALEAGVTLVDGRSADQFEGRAKSPVVPTAGTIPGAVNIPHSDLYSAERVRFAGRDTVAALAADVGLGVDDEAITFCNTGHFASIAWFALSEVLGNEHTRLYDGSMAAWTADPARPVE